MSFWDGFEKQAKSQRDKDIDTVHKFNVEHSSFGKLAPKSAKSLAISGAAVGGLNTIAGLAEGRYGRDGRLNRFVRNSTKGALIGGGLGLAVAAGVGQFWKHRSKDYLKSIPPKTLSRTTKNIGKVQSGKDKEALNNQVLQHLKREGQI